MCHRLTIFQSLHDWIHVRVRRLACARKWKGERGKYQMRRKEKEKERWLVPPPVLEEDCAVEAAGSSEEMRMQTRPHVHFSEATDLCSPDTGKLQRRGCLPGLLWHA